MTLLWSLLFASYISSAEAFGIREKENPIRRIVTLLQEMQKEIETEGEKEEEAFEKFMCYGDGNTDGMKKSAEEGAQKAAELSSKLEALKAEKAQLEQELKDHQSSREGVLLDRNHFRFKGKPWRTIVTILVFFLRVENLICRAS